MKLDSRAWLEEACGYNTPERKFLGPFFIMSASLQQLDKEEPHPYPGWLIVTPTALEFAAVRKGLAGRPGREPGRLMMCGVGEQQSGLFCQKMDLIAPTCLVLIGWGGGLAAGLAAGDVVCADTALREGQQRLFCKVVTMPNVRTGPILTAPRALLTPAEKRAAQASGALAVEMEAYPLAAWANRRGIPFIHVRVILDTFDETLPDLGQGLDSSGQVRLAPLLKILVRRPGLLPELWQLNQRVRAINAVLTKVTTDILQNL